MVTETQVDWLIYTTILSVIGLLNCPIATWQVNCNFYDWQCYQLWCCDRCTYEPQITTLLPRH